MPETASKISSEAWKSAYSQAVQSATLPSEKQLIGLLAQPIPGSDSKSIRKRVRAFRKLVATAPVSELNVIEQKLSNDQQGLGRLYELELSTGFRTALLRSIRRRIGRAHVRPQSGRTVVNAQTGARRSTQSGRKTSPRTAKPATQPSNSPAPETMFSIGPIGVGWMTQDPAGNVIVPFKGAFPSPSDATNLIINPLIEEFQQLKVPAVVTPSFSRESSKGVQLKVTVTNANPIEVHQALAGLQGRYFEELQKTRISEEDYMADQAAKAWAGVWKKFGNIVNPVPFTELGDQGFEVSLNPADAITIIKGTKAIRGLKGQGQINRRAYKPWVKHAGHLKRLTNLFRAGVDPKAWSKAIRKLSAKDQAKLRQLENAEKEVRSLIKAGKDKEAYKLVKKWRKPARKLYNKVRDHYWNDPNVRKQWAEAGADLKKKAPRLTVAKIEGGRRYREKLTVTLEHLTRRNDNPFLAVSQKNLHMSLSYENSVILETIRRIEKGRNVVWSNGPIEQLVRKIEGKLE